MYHGILNSIKAHNLRTLSLRRLEDLRPHTPQVLQRSDKSNIVIDSAGVPLVVDLLDPPALYVLDALLAEMNAMTPAQLLCGVYVLPVIVDEVAFGRVGQAGLLHRLFVVSRDG